MKVQQKLYKKGANVYKIDKLNFVGDGATMMEIDHDAQQVYIDKMQVIPTDNMQLLLPNCDVVSHRLTSPIVTTYIDTEKISFERNKQGIWGWRSDKTETVNSFECKVFGASNVEFVTKTRTEHLSETDKAKARPPKTPLQNFLGIAETEERQQATDSDANVIIILY